MREARTGEKKSFQVQKGMNKGAVAVGSVGVTIGIGIGFTFGGAPGAVMGVVLGGVAGGCVGNVGTGAAIKMAGSQCC